MAKLIQPDGTTTQVEPASGGKFTLEELQKLVGGYIELVPQRGAAWDMLVDEEGRLKQKPLNRAASQLVQQPIVGNALCLKRDEWE